MSEQVKSKQRVADHGEVFTAEREVKAMCDLVKDECERIDSRFLEPACGDGNFLAEILHRKLNVVKSKYKMSSADYEKYSVVAVTSLYGVELLTDNTLACRERLYKIWNDAYEKNCKGDCNEECRRAVRYILQRNILNGNALSMMCVDSDGNDTDEPIIFSEWSLVTGNMIKRRDFRFDVLLKENTDEDNYEMQFSLFDDSPNYSDYWEIDPETGNTIPKAIAEYPLVDYRKIGDDV